MVSYRVPGRWAVTLGPRAINALAVAVCLAFTVLAVKAPWSPLPRPVIAGSGLVAGAAVWFRGRWPVPVTAIGAAANAMSGNPVPLLIGLFSGAGAARGWRLWGMAAIGVLGLLSPEWVAGGRVGANAMLSALAGTAAAMAAGAYAAATATIRHELTRSLRERAERAEAEQQARNERARAAERARLAREMHDVLAHKIALISLHAGGLEVNARAQPARIEREATLIRVTAHEALDELRGILGVLRSERGDEPGDDDCASTDPVDKHPDLRRLVESWVRAGTAVTLDHDVDDMPAATARAAYRLVQEGLTNACKHASGAAVSVQVRGTPGDSVTITVVNEPGQRNGSQIPGAGLGLVGLAERFRLIGGTLHSGPDDGGGWRLEGRLPWLAAAIDPAAREPA